MNKITLRLTVNEGHEESFDNFTANKSINNVSSLIGTPTTRSSGRYGKSLAKGYLSFYNGNLGDKDTKLMSEVNKYNGYMFGTTDSDGKYSLTLTLNGSNFDKIIIYGDNDAKQWATTAIVDGKTIYSDDGIWAIVFEEEKNTHTIEFTEWNKPHYNACITHIDVMLKYLDLDNFWIDNIDSTSQSVPAPNEITYGVLANSGGANIRDLDGEFYDYIKDGILPNSNIPVSLFVNGKQIQAHITNDSDYNETDTMLSLQFTNRLSDTDTLIYSGRNLTDSMSAYSLLLEVLQTLGFSQIDIDEMLDSNMLYGNDNQVGSVKDYLEEITIEYPYLESASYRDTINKICTLAQLNVYENDSGNIKFVSARPVVLQEQVDNAVKITDTYLAEDLNKNIVLKNKYDGIKAEYIENTYEFETIASRRYAQYQTPTTTNIYNENSGMNEQYFPDRRFDRFNDIHSTDGNAYIAFNIPAEDNAQWRYSMFKFTEELGDDISRNDSFRFLFNSENTYRYSDLSGSFEYLMYSSFQTHLVENFKIFNSESEVLNEYFNLSGTTPISSKFIPNFSLAVVISGNNITYYIYKLDAILDDENAGVVYYYAGDVLIQKRVLRTHNRFYNINGANIYDISRSELLTENTRYKTTVQHELISDNIITDYANGVSSGTATIFMGDYYNSAGERVLEWEKGEIPQVGQVVYFENDLKSDRTQRYWKITGRTFRWDSSPLVDLQLQEVRVFA